MRTYRRCDVDALLFFNTISISDCFEYSLYRPSPLSKKLNGSHKGACQNRTLGGHKNEDTYMPVDSKVFTVKKKHNTDNFKMNAFFCLHTLAGLISLI